MDTLVCVIALSCRGTPVSIAMYPIVAPIMEVIIATAGNSGSTRYNRSSPTAVFITRCNTGKAAAEIARQLAIERGHILGNNDDATSVHRNVGRSVVTSTCATAGKTCRRLLYTTITPMDANLSSRR